MKTAEEILKGDAAHCFCEGCLPVTIKAIQLDAYRQACTDMAGLCNSNKQEVTAKHWILRASTQEKNQTLQLLKEAILTARDNKKTI